MKTLVRVSCLFLAFGLLAACSQQAETSPAPKTCANGVCPVSGEAVDASGPNVTYKGETIGFCCEKCMAKFDGMDDAGKQAAVATTKKK